MVCRLQWIPIIGLSLLANVASALDTMTAGDLTRACQRFLADESDAQCVAYIQGYVAGAEQTVVGEQTGQQSSSDFFQRAVRTRLGETTQVKTHGHVYCIPANESFRTFADNIVTAGESKASTGKASVDKMTAESIMDAVLELHYPCEE